MLVLSAFSADEWYDVMCGGMLNVKRILLRVQIRVNNMMDLFLKKTLYKSHVDEAIKGILARSFIRTQTHNAGH